MAEVLISGNGVISLGSVHEEDDLKHRPGIISINPPPEDGRCECCGVPISQLKPFGKAGDPLAGDFEGAYLVKRWRCDFYCDEEQAQADVDSYNSIGSSWECRDCIVLSEKEYDEKIRLLYLKNDRH